MHWNVSKEKITQCEYNMKCKCICIHVNYGEKASKQAKGKYESLNPSKEKKVKATVQNQLH